MHFNPLHLQISTPDSKGSGFALANSSYLVTSYQLVQDHPQVAVSDEQGRQWVCPVVLVDAYLDLALLRKPPELQWEAGLSLAKQLKEQEEVLVWGFSKGALISTPSRVEEVEKEYSGIPFIQHQRQFDYEKIGGALLNKAGEVVGMHAFTTSGVEGAGYALPVSFLRELVEQFERSGKESGVRCPACFERIFADVLPDERCPHCRSELQLPIEWQAEEAEGIAYTVEQMLEKLDYSPFLSRKGPDFWEVTRGSATISISYHEESGLIIGDALLCRISAQTDPAVHAYLLEQNYQLQGLTFSIREENIVLSLLIYDRYFELDTGLSLFEELILQADHFDNILVEQFRAEWMA